MAQTYSQLQQQIEDLQRRADALRAAEINDVVAKIKVAIDHYGLSAAQLGFRAPAGAETNSAAESGAPGYKSAIKYADGKGNVWSGRGPRPRWLQAALAAGGSLENFGRLAKSEPSSASGGTAPSVRQTGRRGPSKRLFRDDAGNQWGGRGPKPRWLQAHLAAGKSLEDFLK